MSAKLPIEPATDIQLTVSVRELVEFVLRTGDLGGGRGGDFVGRGRALAGTRGHQRLQRSRPDGYQSEVPLSFVVRLESLTLTINGRVDGISVEGGETVMEEIKTVAGRWSGQADPLHWSQLRIYACMYARLNNLRAIRLRLSYLDLQNDAVTQFEEHAPIESLEELFERTVNCYLQWARQEAAWRQERDDSIRSLKFPYGEYRPGQRELSVATYRAIAGNHNLFAEAPTGIGKTSSVLFPALKALGEGRAEKVFYLTAKTSLRTVAESAVEEMKKGGLRLRALTLTARDKICFTPTPPCDVQTCRYAIGFYDRLKPALASALECGNLTRLGVEAVAQKYQVCPFALSLHLVPWVDLIICDYNYVFDPAVRLPPFEEDTCRRYVLLVDEAHNLIDRARDIFSADLDTAQLRKLESDIKESLPACAKKLAKLRRGLLRLADQDEHDDLPLFEGGKENGAVPAGDAMVIKAYPEHLTALAEEFQGSAEEWLVQNESASFRELLLETFFQVHHWMRISQIYDQSYLTIVKYVGRDSQVSLYNLDPGPLLRKVIESVQSCIFFSATLSPLHYFIASLGGSSADKTLQLSSPFPAENLRVIIRADIRTSYRDRAGSYQAVANAIAETAAERPGNYLAYFPSYAYMREVSAQLKSRLNGCRFLEQTQNMSEEQRTAYLAEFQRVETHQPLLALAVMGGIFGEGIDLPGERLVGVMVVGVGLPQICVERELLRGYFEEKHGEGFEFAYVYPGLTRVLQAVGRVIRSETDRGTAMLIDERFSHPRYLRLLPAWWQPEVDGVNPSFRGRFSRMAHNPPEPLY